MMKVQKQRLLKLADLLEAEAAKRGKGAIKFDLDGWGTRVSDNDDEIKVDCGTTACAVGYACVSGAFKRSGLTFSPRSSYVASNILYISPEFDGRSDWDAVESFFGLSTNEAEFLFSSDYYPARDRTGKRGERAVSGRIRAFVADNSIAQSPRFY